MNKDFEKALSNLSEFASNLSKSIESVQESLSENVEDLASNVLDNIEKINEKFSFDNLHDNFAEARKGSGNKSSTKMVIKKGTKVRSMEGITFELLGDVEVTIAEDPFAKETEDA